MSNLETYIVILESADLTPAQVIALVYDAWRQTPDGANDRSKIFVKNCPDDETLKLVAGEAVFDGQHVTPLGAVELDMPAVVIIGPGKAIATRSLHALADY